MSLTFSISVCLLFLRLPQISWTYTPSIHKIPVRLNEFNNELKYVNVSMVNHDGIYNCSSESDFQVNSFFFLFDILLGLGKN